MVIFKHVVLACIKGIVPESATKRKKQKPGVIRDILLLKRKIHRIEDTNNV